MTQFIGLKEMARLVQRTGPEDFIRELADYIREDFLRWPEFEKSARLASHSRDGVIELMPASDGHLYGFKYVNGHPANTRMGRLTVTGFGVLADVATGYPLMIAEMTLLTALRTAVTSALAASVLAGPGARTMALIGTGAQSEFQALGFKALLGITELRIFDPDPAALAKFERNVRGLGFNVVRCGSVAGAVAGADIVTTVTAVKDRAAVITPDMIRPGVHINGVGGDCPGKTEIHPDVLRRGSVFVEYPPQTRIEGDIQQMEPDFPVTELWQVLAGEAVGRTSRDAVTIFDSVGFAVEDFSALRFVRDLTRARRYNLDLIPDLENPKDLYGPLVGAMRPREPAQVADRVAV